MRQKPWAETLVTLMQKQSEAISGRKKSVFMLREIRAGRGL